MFGQIIYWSVYGMAFLLMILTIGMLLALTPGQIGKDMNAFAERDGSFYERVRTAKGKRPGHRLRRFLRRLKNAMEATGQGKYFVPICLLSVLCFFLGILFSVLLNNAFLIPSLSAALALLPIGWAQSTVRSYENHIRSEMETALSLITITYLDCEDIVRAVEQNLPRIRGPLRPVFAAFVEECRYVRADVKTALYHLSARVEDDVFLEWCLTLVDAQEEKTQMGTLQRILSQLSDIRLANSEVSGILRAARTEYYLMAGLLIANIPLLYLLNKDWYAALVFSTPGKLVLGLCGLMLVGTYLWMKKMTRPLQTKLSDRPAARERR